MAMFLSCPRTVELPMVFPLPGFTTSLCKACHSDADFLNPPFYSEVRERMNTGQQRDTMAQFTLECCVTDRKPRYNESLNRNTIINCPYYYISICQVDSNTIFSVLVVLSCTIVCKMIECITSLVVSSLRIPQD